MLETWQGMSLEYHKTHRNHILQAQHKCTSFDCFVSWLHKALSVSLVIAKEDLDAGWQEGAGTDLDPLLHAINDLHVLVGEIEIVNLKVLLDALGRHRFGDDGPALLVTPDEQDLLRCLAVSLGNVQELVGLEEWRVGAAKTGVAGGVNTAG